MKKKTLTVTYFKAHETQQKQCVVYKLRHLYKEHHFKELKVCEAKLLFTRSFLPKLNTSQNNYKKYKKFVNSKLPKPVQISDNFS